MKSFLFLIKYIKNNNIDYCIVKIDNEMYTDNLIKDAQRILQYTLANIENTKEYLNNPVKIMKTELVNMNFKNNLDMISKATKNFIFKDENINEYVIRKYPSPDLSILNYIFDNYSTKLFIIDNQSEYQDKNKLNILENQIKRYTRSRNIVTGFYNLKNDKGYIDIGFFNDLLKNDEEKSYVVLLNQNININELEEFTNIIRTIHNIYIIIKSNSNYYRITLSNNKIVFNKVQL